MNEITPPFVELKGKIVPDSYENLNQLYKDLSLQKISVFIGAGMSYETGIPTWNIFLEKLADDLNNFKFPDGDIDEPKLASIIKEEYIRKGKDFYKKIREIIQNRRFTHLPIHRKLLEDSVRFCVTTNFDNVFDDTIKEEDIKGIKPQYYPVTCPPKVVPMFKLVSGTNRKEQGNGQEALYPRTDYPQVTRS